MTNFNLEVLGWLILIAGIIVTLVGLGLWAWAVFMW